MAKVYAMSNRAYLKDGLVKIGLTTDLERRKGQLESGQPYALETIAAIEVPGKYTRDVEKFLHDALHEVRHDKGEWFRLSRERVASIFEKVSNLINVGHAIDGLQPTLSLFNEIVRATSADEPSIVAPAQQAATRQTRGVDFRPYVPDGTKLRYGATENYCTRQGDYLITEDGQTHETPSAALAHIVKLRGGRSKPDGWRNLRIRRGNEWVTLRSLRTDLPEDVRRKK